MSTAENVLQLITITTDQNVDCL